MGSVERDRDCDKSREDSEPFIFSPKRRNFIATTAAAANAKSYAFDDRNAGSYL